MTAGCEDRKEFGSSSAALSARAEDVRLAIAIETTVKFLDTLLTGREAL